MEAMRRVLALSGAVLVLAACSVPQQGRPGPPAKSFSTSSILSATSTAPTAPSTTAMGGTISYPDGLVVSLSKPVTFVPSSSAAGMRADARAIRMVLKVTNDTKSVYDATLVIVSLTYGSDGVAADMVTDYPKVLCSFSQKILPGKSASTTCGFAIDRSTVPVQAQVSLGFDTKHEAPVFTGRV